MSDAIISEMDITTNSHVSIFSWAEAKKPESFSCVDLPNVIIYLLEINDRKCVLCRLTYMICSEAFKFNDLVTWNVFCGQPSRHFEVYKTFKKSYLFC